MSKNNNRIRRGAPRFRLIRNSPITPTKSRLETKASNAKAVFWLIAYWLGIIVLVLTLIFGPFYFVKEYYREVILLQPFDVPESMIEKGMTGEVMVHKLLDRLHYIVDFADAGQPDSPFLLSSDLPEFEIEVAGTRLSPTEFVGFWRGLFDRPYDHLNGELTSTDEGWRMSVRLNGQLIASPVISTSDFDSLFIYTAEMIFQKKEPLLLAIYYTKTGAWVDAIRMAGHDIKTSSVKEEISTAWNIWALTLVNQGSAEPDIVKKMSLYREACKKYSLAATINPRNFLVYNNWGVALAALGQASTVISEKVSHFRDAEEKYASAVALNPKVAPTYYNWGNMLTAWGEAETKVMDKETKFQEAAEKYSNAVSIDPNYFQALTNWGNALNDWARAVDDTTEKMAKFEEAGKKYARAVAINPEHAIAWYSWGTALSFWGRTVVDTAEKAMKFKEAGEKYARATVLDQEYANAWYNWGNTLEDWGRAVNDVTKFQEAAEKFQQYVDVKPDADYAEAIREHIKELLALAGAEESPE